MKHQPHAQPDWLMEFSLAVLIVAILLRGGITVLEHLRRGAAKTTLRQAKTKKKRRRRQGRR